MGTNQICPEMVDTPAQSGCLRQWSAKVKILGNLAEANWSVVTRRTSEYPQLEAHSLRPHLPHGNVR